MAKMKRKKAYLNFHKDLCALYGKVTIYGPFKRNSDGRAIVTIRFDSGRNLTKLYAKFKLEIKLGRILSKDETVDHKDDNPFNDRFYNLELLSLKQNVKAGHSRGKLSAKQLIVYSRSAEGRSKSADRLKGSSNINAALTDKQVKQLRIQYRQGSSIKELSSMFGLSGKSVKYCVSGKTYADVGGPISELLPGKPGRPRCS